MKYSLLTLLSAVLLGSCQSQQAFLFKPTADTHSSVAAVAREPLEPASETTATPAPELTAELPASVASSSARPSSVRVALPKPVATAKAMLAGPVQPAALQLAPDTSLVRPVADTPLHKIKETDLLTNLVRLVGIFVVLAALALILTAFATTSSGWTALAFLVYGFIFLLISIPFFVFRGKNSPRRQELERRRAARRAAAG